MDPRTPFWRGAGATTASLQAGVAVLWETVAAETAVASLVDARGLPLRPYAEALVRLKRNEGDAGRDVRTVALRCARIMSRRAVATPNVVNQVPSLYTSYHRFLTPGECADIETVWFGLLKAGRCSILASVSGALRPGAVRHVGSRLRRDRQLGLFGDDRLMVGDLLRSHSDAIIRRHLP